MKKIISYIFIFIISSIFFGGVAYANFFSDFFHQLFPSEQSFGAWQSSSSQQGSTPVNGDVLQTDGTSSTWVATSTLGITQDLSSYLQTANFGTPFYTFFSATNTDALAEGSTNKYWSNTLFDNRLSATTTLPNITTLANLTGYVPYARRGFRPCPRKISEV